MSKIITDEKIVDGVLTRHVAEIFPSRELLKKKLVQGKKIRLYLGVDPTGELLHVGHLAPLRKLAQFQQLGHEVILLIGDFTGRIGDPTDKSQTRKQLTEAEIGHNVSTYKKQVEKVLDFGGENPVKVMYNSTWLAKLTFVDVVNLAANFTVQQMLERDMFQNRIKENKPISLHEFLYPLMQGYDSVAMDVDLEVGGTDQTFNMLAGRTLLRKLKNKDKFVLTLELLEDNRGRKIGKTEGNIIAIASGNPQDLYGGVMSLGDDTIADAFTACTTLSLEEIEKIKTELAKENPMTYKKLLAYTLVAELYSKESARKAQEEFEALVQEGEPTETTTAEMPAPGVTTVFEFLKIADSDQSSAEAKRLITQGGVEINGAKATNVNEQINLKSGDIVKIGKRRFVKMI